MLIKDLLLIVVGILTGAINSVAGGGMLIGFPVLLLVGMPALAANATANVITLTGQITSSIGYRKYLKRIPPSYLLLMIPCAIGASIGAYILRRTSNSNFELIVPGLILIAVLVFIFQPYIHARLYGVSPKPRPNNKPSLFIYLLVLPLAVYGGYFGAGFGLVMLAILSLTKLKNIHEMNGLKNLTAVAIAAFSILVLFNSHLINWHYGVAMSIGTAIGGYLGARLAQRFSVKFVRFVVIIIGLLTAIYLAAITIG